MSVDEKDEDPMIGDILSSIKSIINESESEPEVEEENDPVPALEEEALFDIPEETFTPEPIQSIPEASPEPASMAPSDLVDDIMGNLDESIISTTAADLGAQQFVKLNNMIRMGNSNVSLSDIVRSLLRPMLREWLDENLPPMVERMVEYEIKRLVNRIDTNK